MRFIVIIAIAVAADVGGGGGDDGGGGGHGGALWKGVGLDSGDVLVWSLKTRTRGYGYVFFTGPNFHTCTPTCD
jgi:hypothetical protein